MNPLRKFFGSRDDVPEWAKFLTPEQFQVFVAAVEAELRRLGIPHRMGDGVVRVERPGAAPADWGLLNLAQLCGRIDRAEWTPAIRVHFDTLVRNLPIDETRKLAGDFAAARKVLKVRLYHPDYLTTVGAEALVHRAPAEGLVAALVYDLPATVASVKPEDARRWGPTDDELFRIGLENVRGEGRIAPRVNEVEGSATISALIGDSFFTASRALLLEDYLGPATPHGALVAIPHRHAVLFHPIEGMAVVHAIQAMIPAAFGMHQEGPGSISPDLYWWRAGKLVRLPSKVTPKSIEFAPPDEFVEEVLNRFAS